MFVVSFQDWKLCRPPFCNNTEDSRRFFTILPLSQKRLRTQNGSDLITEIARCSYDVLIASTGRKQKLLNRRMMTRNEKTGITDGTEIIIKKINCFYSYAVSEEIWYYVTYKHPKFCFQLSKLKATRSIYGLNCSFFYGAFSYLYVKAIGLYDKKKFWNGSRLWGTKTNQIIIIIIYLLF